MPPLGFVQFSVYVVVLDGVTVILPVVGSFVGDGYWEPPCNVQDVAPAQLYTRLDDSGMTIEPGVGVSVQLTEQLGSPGWQIGPHAALQSGSDTPPEVAISHLLLEQV